MSRANAFRHPRNMHPSRRWRRSSTTTSAQRLPASEDHARAVQSLCHHREDSCSTPSGIRGSCTAESGQAPLPCRDVLNAFRHPRIMHTGVMSASAALLVRAQRLPASEDHALQARQVTSRRAVTCSTPSGIRGSCTRAVGGSGPRDRCAQRLPASEAHARESIDVPWGTIRCSTPSGIRGSCTLEELLAGEFAGVLNAFRHPRIMHSGPGGAVHRAVECSTPSGIRGSCTPLSGRADLRAPGVLNAFRHPRIMHEVVLDRSLRRQLCSTPSGIRGSCTRRDGSFTRSRWSAQRLPASEDHAPWPPARTSPSTTSAQRLPASEDHAQGAPPVDVGNGIVCSTPSGIRGSCTLVSARL